MAFIKDDSEASTRLVEKMDRLVQEHKDQGLRGFVVYIAGSEKKERLEQIAVERQTSIPLTVLLKGTDDPALQKYKIDLSAANTVIVYKKKKAVYVGTNVAPEAFGPVIEAAKSIVSASQ